MEIMKELFLSDLVFLAIVALTPLAQAVTPRYASTEEGVGEPQTKQELKKHNRKRGAEIHEDE